MFCVAHFRKILVSYLADRKVQVAQCFLYVSWKFCVVYFCEIFTLLYFDLAYNQILFSMRCPSFENIIVGRSKSGNKRAVFTLRVSKIIDCVFVLIINFKSAGIVELIVIELKLNLKYDLRENFQEALVWIHCSLLQMKWV